MAKASARRIGGVLVGTLLATIVGLSPLAVQPAQAAGPLRIAGDTTYTVDPADGRIHVALKYTVKNNKPNTATTIYYYRTLNLGIQDDARSIRATDASGRLGLTTIDHENFTEVRVRLRANLYYGRTTTFTLRYDLVGGKPRSDSPTRVTRAFVTFGVWAFGDRDLGTVEVRMPAHFTSTIEGGPMTTTTSTSGNVLKASPDSPDAFFAIVTGENNAEYERELLSLPGGVDIAVLSWPEDAAWSEAVTETLRAGMPELQEEIGLEWPVDELLDVRERYTPSLEGYAGLFFTEEQRIDVSEDLDPVTIMHEASHAWFNHDLFAYRWIYEGLAEEYAWRVQKAVGGDNVDLPEKPDKDGKGNIALNTWTFPDVVRDDTDDVELYGYRASFWLVHLIVETAGEDQMREAFANAQANRTAYPGAGQPETVGREDDWRRFLDLTQPLDEPDPEPVLQALTTYVLGGLSASEMSDRHAARQAYRELLAAGDGWTPPWYIREPMGTWLFRDAAPRMADATAVLALRDRVETAATAEGLVLGDQLEAAYEGATDGFTQVTALGQQQLDAVEAIAAARVKVDAPGDLVAQLGLLGETPPSAAYEAARTAFAAGDMALAISSAQSAASIVARAPVVGQERVVMGAIILAALVALLVFIVLLRRRRGRRPLGVEPGSAAFLALDARFAPGAASDAGAMEPPGSAPIAPPGAAVFESSEPSGTLGADPDVLSPPLGEDPPARDGGEPP